MIFSDTIHGRVHIPDNYESYTEGRPLTRLRNVRQLGFTPSVYTGAVHTRFEHTIGKTKVLIDLLDQFQVDKESLREKYIRASLLQEIGTFPFSHSTAWLFTKRMGMSKTDYAKVLCDSFFRTVSESLKHFIWGNHDQHDWFRKENSAFRDFESMTLLKLAGDIDYTLRDAHYSGRYSNSFDYRYFRTLVDIDSPSCQEEIAESIRELYRSIYALNSVYGGINRRFLTLIFIRLSDFLVDNNYLDINKYKEGHYAIRYADLDDDKFMSILRDATVSAEEDGYLWAKTMLDFIEQLKQVNIQKTDIPDESVSKSFREVESHIARENDVDERQVVAINDHRPNAIGYDLFGKRFACYRDAIESEHFKRMTGLREGTNITGLLDERSVFYAILA